MVGRDIGRGGNKSLLIAGFHRADPRLDEGDVVLGQAIFLVEFLVRPNAVPRLLRYPRVRRACGMLGDLAERNQKPQESCAHVTLNTLSSVLAIHINEEIRL